MSRFQRIVDVYSKTLYVAIPMGVAWGVRYAHLDTSKIKSHPMCYLVAGMWVGLFGR